MQGKLLSRSAIYLAIATFAVSMNCYAQDKPIDIQIHAGLSVPVGEDNLNTGMTLGATAGYGLTENIAATGALIFNRYGLEDGSRTGHFPIIKVLGGVRYTTTSDSQLRYFGSVEVGFARSELNFDTELGLGKSAVDLGGQDSATDLSFRLGGGVLYDFTPTAAVGVSAHLNNTSGQDAAHIDLPTFFVRFAI